MTCILSAIIWTQLQRKWQKPSMHMEYFWYLTGNISYKRLNSYINILNDSESSSITYFKLLDNFIIQYHTYSTSSAVDKTTVQPKLHFVTITKSDIYDQKWTAVQLKCVKDIDHQLQHRDNLNKMLPFAMLLNLFQLRPLCMMPPVFTYTTKSLSFHNNSQDHLTNTETCDGHYMYNQLIKQIYITDNDNYAYVGRLL